jgi:hypothetical protein
MDKYVVVNEEFRLAVCTTCESGIWGNVSRHFADNHKDTWKGSRKELKQHIKLMQLAKKEDGFMNYHDPYEVREAVAGINVHEG